MDILFYPGLLDRKNRSDMCPRWESNPRLPACKASTLSTFVKPACGERDIVVTFFVGVWYVHTCINLAIASTFMHEFQNDLAQMLPLRSRSAI